MNIYVSHSVKMNYKNELYEPIRNSQLNSKHTFILPHEFQDAAYNVKPEMRNGKIDLVIADLSLPATGQGIEMGWADMLNIPIICIYKKGAVTSRSTRIVARIFEEYADIQEIPESIERALNKLIKIK